MNESEYYEMELMRRDPDCFDLTKWLKENDRLLAEQESEQRGENDDR